MFDNKNELEAREEILSFVDEYCKKYHAKKEYHEGDRISYASRVYDSAGNEESCEFRTGILADSRSLHR